jgi:hypothetical protein
MGSGAHTATLLGALYLGGKSAGLDAKHSSLSSDEVANIWRHTFTPPYVFTAWRLIKQGDKFTFVF